MGSTDVLNFSTRTGELEIDSVPMHTPAWNVLDCTPLWLNAAIRGQNIVLPGQPGTHPYPYRVHEARISLEMVVTGWHDQAGVPYADQWEGLETNLDYLRNNVAAPPAGTTRPATLTMPSGAVRSADVQVVEFVTGGLKLDGVRAAILTLVIPSGRFA